MKRVLLTVVVAILIPGLLNATAVMGVFFDPDDPAMASGSYSPAGPLPFVFDAHIMLYYADQYVTGVEYQLLTPDDPGHSQFAYQGVVYPDNMSVELGDPFTGHAITFWPPLNGYLPGYNVCCTLRDCFILTPCASWPDYPVVIGPHPGSEELRGTYMPDNDFFPIVGTTSILCPDQIAVEEKSWGAIKTLFE